jgi:hypothetical protein
VEEQELNPNHAPASHPVCHSSDPLSLFVALTPAAALTHCLAVGGCMVVGRKVELIRVNG